MWVVYVGKCDRNPTTVTWKKCVTVFTDIYRNPMSRKANAYI